MAKSLTREQRKLRYGLADCQDCGALVEPFGAPEVRFLCMSCIIRIRKLRRAGEWGPSSPTLGEPPE